MVWFSLLFSDLSKKINFNTLSNGPLRASDQVSYILRLRHLVCCTPDPLISIAFTILSISITRSVGHSRFQTSCYLCQCKSLHLRGSVHSPSHSFGPDCRRTCLLLAGLRWAHHPAMTPLLPVGRARRCWVFLAVLAWRRGRRAEVAADRWQKLATRSHNHSVMSHARIFLPCLMDLFS